MSEAFERERSELRHAQAGLAVSLRLVKEFHSLLTIETLHMTIAEFGEWRERLVREAEELLQVSGGEQLAGEVPPIPPLEVPPMPGGPVVGLNFWRRGGND